MHYAFIFFSSFRSNKVQNDVDLIVGQLRSVASHEQYVLLYFYHIQPSTFLLFSVLSRWTGTAMHLSPEQFCVVLWMYFEQSAMSVITQTVLITLCRYYLALLLSLFTVHTAEMIIIHFAFIHINSIMVDMLYTVSLWVIIKKTSKYVT